MLAFAALISGCRPAGPRALLEGKALLESGDYAGAVAELKTATSLMATNAQAWNYLGVALQYAGQPTEAAQAYGNALRFDRDLMEAHYNLGCLWLEQNKPDAARTEFTAYTLRRNNAPEGWAKLGSAQLRAGDLPTAEKSFATALSLNQTNVEALNGMGVARARGGKPQDAARFFAAAAKARPDYAPALLNLATVQQQYLHDDALALKNYHAYLALSPRPANYDAVSALAKNLEQGTKFAAASPPPSNVIEPPSSATPETGETKTPAPVASRPVAAPKSPPVVRSNSAPPPQVVRVEPEPEIVATPGASPPVTEPSGETPAGTKTAQPSVWHRLNPANWFGSSTQQNYVQSGVTPLPSASANNQVESAPPPAPVAESKPIRIIPPAPPSFPRYMYLSPRKPKAGDRKAAARAFAEAQQFEQKQDWAGALDAYQRAAQLDPAWFEVQYNCGVLAYRQKNFDQSLSAYEMALAIQPGSVDARYNFALGLKAAGYVTDAVNELKKILSARPGEARAHLALANLCSQQLHDPAQARQHYLKVLELDPNNPEAANIQFWLSANPP